MTTRGMPRRTKIMGQTYTIRVMPDLKLEHQSDEGAIEHLNVLGLSDSDQQIIAIDPHQGEDRLRDTYLHEHLHAMVAIAGLNRDVLDGDRDERMVKRLAPILLQFLRDNPRVYTFLTGRETYR